MTSFHHGPTQVTVGGVPRQEPVFHANEQDHDMKTEAEKGEQSACFKSKDKLPAEVEKQLHKVVKTFESDLRIYINWQGRVEKTKEDVKVHGEPGLKSQSGTRPFKSPVELTDLDNVISDCVNGDSTWVVKLPMGTTKRQAMGIIHHVSQACTSSFPSRLFKRNCKQRRRSLLGKLSCQSASRKRRRSPK